MPLRTVTRAALLVAAAMTAAVCFSGDVLGASHPLPTTEVIVTLKGAPLSGFGRTLQSASHATYTRQLEAAQGELARRVESAVPAAQVRWRYHLVADGLAVVVPRSEVAALARVPGRRPCLAERSLPRASRSGGAGADRRGQALGPERSRPRGTG